MGFGIVLTLDPSTDSAIRKIWHKFDNAHIGKTPGYFNEPPHISFSVDLEAKADDIHSIIDQTPFTTRELKLTPYGIFPGKQKTIYLKAELSNGLLESHRVHYEILVSREIRFNIFYAPGKVVFHCTIAVDINEDQLEKAINIMADHKETIKAYANTIQLWEYFPAHLLYQVPI
jgi:2'-5' RNA ligase